MGWLDTLLTKGLDAWTVARRYMPSCSLCSEPAVFRCASCGAFVCHMHAFVSASPIQAVCRRCMGHAFPFAKAEGDGSWPYAESPWDVLGVQQGASPEEVKTAYRAASQRCHPDHGGSATDQAKVNAAYREVMR